MKKLKIISVIALLGILALVIVNYNMLSTAEKDTVPPTILVEKDTSLPLGTAANPFVVLEIVPHESMAEVGYLIPGCEPIDMDALMVNQNLINNYTSRFCSNPWSTDTSKSYVAEWGDDIVDYLFPDEIQKGYEVSEYDTNKYNENLRVDYSGNGQPLMDTEGIIKGDYRNYGMWLKTGWPVMLMEGYYEKVGEGEGCFDLKETVSGETTEYSFKFVGVHNGSYRWVTAPNEDKIPTDYLADRVWTERSSEGTGYYVYKQYNIVHNDDLIKKVFDDTPSSQIEKQVITVTPDYFLNEDNLALIDQADFIYMHRSHDSGLIKLWANLNKDDAALEDKDGNAITESEALATTFADNDMPWPAVIALIDRMSYEDPAALIMDESVYVSTDKSNNCRKLVLMLRQYGPKIFNEIYLDPKNPKVVESEVQEDGLTTGIFYKDKDTAIKDWEESTFWPDIPNQSTEYLIEYGMKNPTFTAQNQWDMIQDNIYFYEGAMNMLDDFLKSTAVETDENGEAFDYYEDLYGERPTDLTANEVVKYLLQDLSKKRKLKILEVQPCNKFIYGSDGWEVYYLSMFTWFEGDLKNDVEIVTMPTWEFNSSIEDLNSEYDAIIIGVNQDVSNGANGYQDSNMNTYVEKGVNKGLAYTSIGDIVTTSSKKDTTGAMTLSSDTSMRYSGTDITSKKLQELKGYLNSGKPVIMDRNLLNRDRTINTNLIDVDSNMYQFVSLYGKKSEEVDSSTLFVRGLYQANKLKRALAYETCKIEFDTADGGSGYPVTYTYEPDAKNGTITNVTYSPTRTFEYKFKIVGKTGQLYGIDLFIDMNGDGVYEGSLKEPDYEEVLANGTGEQVNGIIIRDRSGNVVNSQKLYANVTYTLTKSLEDSYQGILPWKLEAHKVDNPNCRNSVINYSAVKSSTGEKEKIKVLLMNLTPDMTARESYYRNNGISWAVSNGFINMADMEQFQRYISCVDEYDIELKFLENEDWMKLFDSKREGFTSAAVENNADNIRAWKQYLDGYDMLILGFNDDCTYTNNYIYNEGFKYFVSCGKSVIMSHDMVRDTSQNKPLITNFDEQLRELMSQRRYYTDTVKMNNQEISLLGQNTRNYAVTLDDGTVVPGVLDNSTRQYIVFGNQGKSDRDTFLKGNWGSNEGVTKYVNVINQGQITNYPYKINDIIQVAETHAQNFQLNLEDEDIVVWYGLTDKYSGTYAEEIKEYEGKNFVVDSNKLSRGIYSSVEGDGRNSFYIYNIGNITYTGLGHKKNMTDEEVQLFVNTMISAYRRAAAPPSIEITNEDAIINGDEATLYITVDESNFDDNSQYIDVCFKVVDPSLVAVAGRSYVLEYRDKDGNVLAETTYNQDTNAVVASNATAALVEIDGKYYFRVPYSKVKEQGVAEYELILRSSYVDAENNSVDTENSKKVYIMPMPLFTLN